MSRALNPTTKHLAVCVDRVALIRALDRSRQVVPAHCVKPILTCVHLEASNGLLRVRATDGELALFTQAPAEGELAACAVPCGELIQRLKASKSSTCTLALSSSGEELLINNGRVGHALHTLNAEDCPVVASQPEGDSVTVDAGELCHALRIAGHGAAREPSRYAIDGILLESDGKGTRLVATDGRRLVIVNLQNATGGFAGQAILPHRMTKVIEKFTVKHTDCLIMAVQRNATEDGEPLPARLYAAGPDWLLSTYESDGRFPIYRDVVPRSHSKFAVVREALLETLSEVAIATNEDSRMVRVDLSRQEVRLSAEAPGVGKSEAALPVKYLGGGDAEIHTAFNPAYLLEALKTLSGETVVMDVDQNGCGSDGKVFGKPALLYAEHEPRTRWVLMPVNAGLDATRANLGSNYREGPASAAGSPGNQDGD